MTMLGEYLSFNDAKLARRFQIRRMPMTTLYEAYFDGALDIRGCGSETSACFQVVLYKNIDAYDRARFVGRRAPLDAPGFHSSATR